MTEQQANIIMQSIANVADAAIENRFNPTWRTEHRLEEEKRALQTLLMEI